MLVEQEKLEQLYYVGCCWHAYFNLLTISYYRKYDDWTMLYNNVVIMAK